MSKNVKIGGSVFRDVSYLEVETEEGETAKFWDEVPVVQDKAITENGVYTCDAGYDGLGTVTVAVEASGGGSSVVGGYGVTFSANGLTYAYVSVTAGQSVARPTGSPARAGYAFAGWYTEAEGGERVKFPFVPTEDTTIYAHFTASIVLGVTGLTGSTGVLTLTDAAADVAAYETSANGDYTSVSNDLDAMWPFSAIEEYTDADGNVMVKFPKFWMKWLTNDSGVIDGYQIANGQVDEDYFIPDAFLDPKCYGTDEYTYLDYFALGKYEASGSSSKMYSKTGATCLVNITRANARAGARAYGTSANYYNGYQQLDFAQLIAYNLLCMMYYRTANIQKVYGGRTGSVSGHSWSAASVTGTTDGCVGMNGWNTSTDCVKMLGIENPFGNIFKWVDGVYFSGSTIYAHKFPQHHADSSANGKALGFSRPTSSNYIKSMKHGTESDTPQNDVRSYAYASDVTGSETTYYGDYCYYSSSGVVLTCGGDWNDAGKAGLWCLYGRDSASSSDSSVGARLSFRPL